MRTPFLAAALGLGLAGCLVGESDSTTGGGDDDTGSNPGSGSNPSTKQVDITVDKATMSTELKTVNPINITVTGSGGFSGSVALTAAIVDANQNPITDWIVDLSSPSVTLSANGTANVMATVHIPPMTTAITGTLKVSSTSAATLGTSAATTAFTALKQVTFAVKYDPTTQSCVYPADGGTAANPVKVTQATKIRFFNTGADPIVIHVSANQGVPISHQGQTPNGNADPSTEANTAYEQTPIGTGAASWYCHSTPAGAGKDPGALGPRVLVQ
jgi:hypothetical protein